MSDFILSLSDIRKSFDDTEVLKGISLDVARGEFLTLLGSSGCGKTTTLRIIAGLETPTEGRVMLDGRDVTGTPPEKRDVNTVFQNYALFPHMNVAQNIGYGLKVKRVPKDEIDRQVQEMLNLVQLSGFEKRMPGEMSGGQRQRVAIARALINKPSVLLLDEPLGALDLQLRRQMQLELKKLQQKLGITFIYITHDQEEALNMSDRIAVMKEGRFEQVGTPAEVYNFPRTSFVANFVGSANVLTGVAEGPCPGGLRVALHGGHAFVNPCGHSLSPGTVVNFAVRSENVKLCAEAGETCFAATVCEKSLAGGLLRIVLKTEDGSELIATRHGIDSPYRPGDRVYVTWSAEDAVAVDLEEQP